MNLGLRLFLYSLITAGCAAALAGGVHWLVTPDPALMQAAETKPAPIPPRIIESIERKIPSPPQEPAKVEASPPAELHTAPVSLPVPPILEPPKRRAIKVTRGSRHRNNVPATETYFVPAATGRTDFPF